MSSIDTGKTLLKFRLSTLLFSVAICAVLLGWFVDRSRLTNFYSMVGIWRFPSEEENQMGYESELLIREDGSFVKVQQYRMHQVVFRGNVSLRNNKTVFQVSTVEKYLTMIGPLFGERISSERSSDEYSCSASFDRSGRLHISQSSKDDFNEVDRIRWESYCRASKRYLNIGTE